MKNYGWNAFFEDERLELLETILGSIAAKSHGRVVTCFMVQQQLRERPPLYSGKSPAIFMRA
jgi:hypothetical protein